MDRFKNVVLIGEGTYGRVYKAVWKETGGSVAIKRIDIEPGAGLPLTAIREIKMLKKLQSTHIVRLQNTFFAQNSLYLIMEFLPFDLSGLIQTGYVFSSEQIRSLSHQLVDAARYIHSRGLIHRDIKSGNILLDKRGCLKLADFGLTRDAEKLMTNRVCTLWYRAPELLLGAQSYDLKVDSWSIACVILEMGMGRPPFRGNDEVSQIKAIFESLGAPAETYMWSDILEQKKYPTISTWSRLMRDTYGTYFEDGMLELVGELLRLSPRERISPLNAIKLDILSKCAKRPIPIISEEAHEHYCRRGREEDSRAGL